MATANAATRITTRPPASLLAAIVKQRWPSADERGRAAIQAEALELSADLAHWLREISAHVLERQERVLSALR